MRDMIGSVVGYAEFGHFQYLKLKAGEKKKAILKAD